MGDFLTELEQLLNRYCLENGSDTPDFILATYLKNCLDAWDDAVSARERWYGRALRMVAKTPPVAPPDAGTGGET